MPDSQSSSGTGTGSTGNNVDPRMLSLLTNLIYQQTFPNGPQFSTGGSKGSSPGGFGGNTELQSAFTQALGNRFGHVVFGGGGGGGPRGSTSNIGYDQGQPVVMYSTDPAQTHGRGIGRVLNQEDITGALSDALGTYLNRGSTSAPSTPQRSLLDLATANTGSSSSGDTRSASAAQQSNNPPASSSTPDSLRGFITQMQNPQGVSQAGSAQAPMNAPGQSEWNLPVPAAATHGLSSVVQGAANDVSGSLGNAIKTYMNRAQPQSSTQSPAAANQSIPQNAIPPSAQTGVDQSAPISSTLSATPPVTPLMQRMATQAAQVNPATQNWTYGAPPSAPSSSGLRPMSASANAPAMTNTKKGAMATSSAIQGLGNALSTMFAPVSAQMPQAPSLPALSNFQSPVMTG